MADAGEAVRPDESVGAPLTSAHTSNNQTLPVEGSSDGEEEKSARERLKKTTIAGMSQQSTPPTASDPTSEYSSAHATAADSGEAMGNGARGRPAKKRSFEDLTRSDIGAGDGDSLAEQPNPKSGHHKRMRSRDVASGEHAAGAYDGNAASPVREENDGEVHKSPETPGATVKSPKDEAMPDSAAVTQASKNLQESVGEQVAAQDADAATVAEKAADITSLPASSSTLGSSGFANVSSTSPFGAVKSPPLSTTDATTGELKPASSAAFASSGLAAFATSEKSPFGTAAKSAGGFGGGSSTGFASSGSGFGSASGFGTKALGAGFGTSSGGFGSASGSAFGSAGAFGTAKPFGSGISSFAGSSGVPGSFGSGKPFGMSKEKDDEDEGSNDDEDESVSNHGNDEQDERFVAQDVETGEEAERTVFTCRAKLFHFEKEWKERGVGTIKINVSEATTQIDTKDVSRSDEDVEENASSTFSSSRIERKARLIMRTDGVHRVILNTPIFKNMTIGQSDGSAPVGKTMHLTGLEDGKPRVFQIKIGKEDMIKDLYRKVVDLRQDAKV